jgi:hypothetical protein
VYVFFVKCSLLLLSCFGTDMISFMVFEIPSTFFLAMSTCTEQTAYRCVIFSEHPTMFLPSSSDIKTCHDDTCHEYSRLICVCVGGWGDACVCVCVCVWVRVRVCSCVRLSLMFMCVYFLHVCSFVCLCVCSKGPPMHIIASARACVRACVRACLCVYALVGGGWLWVLTLT